MATDTIDTQTLVVNARRFCTRCGKQGKTYRSLRALRCTDCDEIAAQERAEFARGYHSARSKAVSRLVKAYHDDFERLLREELRRTG